MAWIESHQELWYHPKTKKFARLLGVSVPTAVGHLHGLWYWALDFAQDGVIGRYEPEEISDAVLWGGDPQQFLDALINAGFADKTPNGPIIHDWREYAGKLLDRRAVDRERKRKSAKLPQHSNGVPREFQRKDLEIARTPYVQYPTVPNTTGPNRTVPSPDAPAGGSESQIDAGEKESSLYAQRFSEFWKSYPKKVGKTAALKSWLRIKPTAELHTKIMQAVAWQSKTEQWAKDGGQFIPNPTTWLNQGRWENEPMGGGLEHGTGTDQQHPQSWTRGFHE